MPVPTVADSYKSAVNRVVLGATQDTGGTRSNMVEIGGSVNVVYGGAPDQVGLKPVVAIDVLDSAPTDWPEVLLEPYKDVLDKPGAWAKMCVDELGADLICIKFEGIHPDKGDKGADHAVAVTKEVLEAVKVPLVLWGCGHDEKDNQVMPKVSEAAKGENCLIGAVTEGNYKSLTAIALADGHHLITEAPLDINIGKQVNILVADMGFPLEKVVTYQTTGALGYGLEYIYSIQERQRMAALGGDKMMSQPAICDVGYEAWRAKEAKTPDAPEWGVAAQRGPMWEAATAVCLLQAGVDVIRMRHPLAVQTVKQFIDKLYN